MRRLQALVAAGLFAFALNANPFAQTPNANRAVAGQILVKFRPGANGQAKADAHRQGGGRVENEIAGMDLQLVAVPAGDEPGAINRYRRNPNVVYAEPNFIRSIPEPASGNAPISHILGTGAIPGDNMFNEQWALHNTGQPFYCLFPGFCLYVGTPDADIDAPEAWETSTGSAITVAVIDTGIDYTHPDLAANYAGGVDYVTADGDPMDDHGHGTHVAGTIAAALNNLTGEPAKEEGVVGVAPLARIRAYKVCDANGSCNDFAIQQAIVQAVADGAKVINMSLGGAEVSQGLDDAVQFAWNAGVVIVAGAGNDGNTSLFYPAAFDHVISVAAFDEDHRRATFSNYGDWVDISAPGNAILSTYPLIACGGPSTVPGDIGCYNFLSGTSMATPHVSGAAALVWSRSDVTSNQQVVDILLNSADRQGVDPVRLDSWTIHGGLNLHEAMSFGSTGSPATRVTVSAGPTKPLEAGPTSGTFVLTRTGDDISAALDVHLTLAGTATSGADYAPVPDIATFAAGASTTVVTITPIDDPIVEQDETVVLTIVAGTGYSPGAQSSATLAIGSDDVPSDLIVSAVTAPAVGGAGASISVNETTKNQGSGQADASVTGFYLSANTLWDAADTPLGTRTVPVLAPGAVNNAVTTLTIPANTAAGTYYIVAKADANAAIVEASETNNVRASGLLRVGPDLTISSITVPATAGEGVTIMVSDVTLNSGGGEAGPSRTSFYLSTNTTYDATDKPIGGRDIGTLVVNGSSNGSTPAVIPAGTVGGVYYVIARADDANSVIETQETNNTRASGAIRVGADLTVSSLTAPAVAGDGATVTVTEATSNIGGADAVASTTAFYLSSNTTLEPADPLIGSRDLALLAAGTATPVISTPVVIPANTGAGTYYIIAKADQNNTVIESQETNNIRVSGVIRIGPDLIVSAMSVTQLAAAGGTITVTDTAKNQGAGSPAGASSTTFYLSTNPLLDAADVVLGSRPVQSLATGQTSTASTILQLPAGIATGGWFVFAKADSNNQVVEGLETNNTFYVSFKVGPDLQASALSLTGTPVAGGSVTVTDATKNAGGGAAGPSTTRCYLSTNTLFDASDQLMGSRDVPGLAAGASNTGSATCTIPPGTASGTWFVVVVADGTNAVVETVEYNNAGAIVLRIP